MRSLYRKRHGENQKLQGPLAQLCMFTDLGDRTSGKEAFYEYHGKTRKANF